MPTWHTATTADGEHTVTVPSDLSEPLPLADALAAALPELFPTSTSAKRACRRKAGAYRVLLSNGRDGRCEHKVRGGETFRVVVRPPSGSATVQLAVVLEEEDVAVVHKPAGMLVHGDGPNTLHSALGRVLPGAVREAPVMELSRSQQLRRPAQQWTAAEERPSAAAAAASASARAIPPPWRPLLPSG